MKLYHVSEESNILEFYPRTPVRNDLDKSKGLVWALTEKCLPNFLTPRDCPCITYHVSKNTIQDDICKFFSSTARHCIAIEHVWYEQMTKTSLYLYEFDPSTFYLQDEQAGYYVSEQIQKPLSIIKIDDLFDELFKRSVEIRILENLWILADEVKKSTLNWSLCDMANAIPRS